MYKLQMDFVHIIAKPKIVKHLKERGLWIRLMQHSECFMYSSTTAKNIKPKNAH